MEEGAIFSFCTLRVVVLSVFMQQMYPLLAGGGGWEGGIEFELHRARPCWFALYKHLYATHAYRVRDFSGTDRHTQKGTAYARFCLLFVCLFVLGERGGVTFKRQLLTN